ncbi:hypothetical protein OHA25_40895 [Nonomuraea sp. NBC_00507]|uniref:hypothetical protein n=1 Tax=Nonomuraea sp. NBC_00507 TaxID=2976002 RepID=UPI002E18ACA9
MIRRKVIGLAVAATFLGGASVYGAATASAATPAPAPTPSATSTPTPNGNHDGMDRDAMIRHCTDHLPADQRDKARQQMEDMMSGSMMGGMSQHGSGMMG